MQRICAWTRLFQFKPVRLMRLLKSTKALDASTPCANKSCLQSNRRSVRLEDSLLDKARHLCQLRRSRGYGSGTSAAIFLNPFERARLYHTTTGDSNVTRSFSEDWNRALGQTRNLAANCGDLSLVSHLEHRTPLAMLAAMIAGQPACGIPFGN